MASNCSTTDFMFPMLADIYYPIVDQGAYGNIKKHWVFDKTVACNFSVKNMAAMEEVKTNVNITKEGILVGRTKGDLRISSEKDGQSITNVIVTNIRTPSSPEVYMETSGPRAGKGTIYEIFTNEPIVGFLNNVEYYKVVLKRSENQAVDI